MAAACNPKMAPEAPTDGPGTGDDAEQRAREAARGIQQHELRPPERVLAHHAQDVEGDRIAGEIPKEPCNSVAVMSRQY